MTAIKHALITPESKDRKRSYPKVKLVFRKIAMVKSIFLLKDLEFVVVSVIKSLSADSRNWSRVMHQVVLTPLEWSRMSDVEETEPLGIEDETCLREVRDVLMKHGKSAKFGISLLHTHFDLADDECLVETIDEDQRVLTTQVKSTKDLTGIGIPTSWKFTDADVVEMVKCYKWCEPKTGTTGHTHKHDMRPW